jgi:hypothetical protein
MSSQATSGVWRIEVMIITNLGNYGTIAIKKHLPAEMSTIRLSVEEMQALVLNISWLSSIYIYNSTIYA